MLQDLNLDFFIMHENIYVLLEKNMKNLIHLHLNSVVLQLTLLSYTCHDIQGYTAFQTYRADKTLGCVSVFIIEITCLCVHIMTSAF